jgi:hypothetical protein
MTEATMQMNEPEAHFGAGQRKTGPVILDLKTSRCPSAA